MKLTYREVVMNDGSVVIVLGNPNGSVLTQHIKNGKPS